MAQFGAEVKNKAIRVEDLSKRYQLGAVQQSYRTLRDSLADACARPFRALRSGFRRASEPAENGGNVVWALQDICLEVDRGEVVGVIGRNGAGKSTLLKILSRITEPTSGFAEMYGRAGALLEVGTGFHGELTGRENIYLNGAILGMRRADIERKFDEIVAFAEVEKFIDTPVKHYSSGMYLRLAFAVAAHLEPEILLVDEVLAVGDAAFQKKCLGQMGKVARQGRTVLFVSHNMAAVRSLCSRAVVLDRGRLCFAGETEHAIHHYNRSLSAREAAPRGGLVSLTDIRINNKESGAVSPSEPFAVSCRLHLQSDLSGFFLFCTIQDGAGEQIAVVGTDHRELSNSSEAGSHDVAVHFPGLWLRTGVYSVHFKLIASALGLEKSRFVSDHAMLDVLGDSHPGIVRSYLTPDVEWQAQRVEPALVA